MFLSLPPVTRRRSSGSNISVQRSSDQWSTPSVDSQAEVLVSTVAIDIPVVQIDQRDMAGIEEMMRQLQESMRIMQ